MEIVEINNLHPGDLIIYTGEKPNENFNLVYHVRDNIIDYDSLVRTKNTYKKVVGDFIGGEIFLILNKNINKSPCGAYIGMLELFHDDKKLFLSSLFFKSGSEHYPDRFCNILRRFEKVTINE